MADDDTQTKDTNGAAATANGDAAAQANGQQQAQLPQMQVLAQFVRDMSFENVAAQKNRAMEGQPDISVKVGLDARKRTQEGQFEVAVKLNVAAKAKGTEDVIFAMELDYAGIFAVANVPENQMHPYLLIECPRMLFPFIRRIVSDVTRDGGFPPLNLEQIDFVALYRQELARRAQSNEGAATQA